MSTFTTHTINPQSTHTHTMILLAGRGTTASEYASELADSRNAASQSIFEFFRPGHCRFVILGAPERETVFGPQPEWFDLASTSEVDLEEERQEAGLRKSTEFVRRVIESELNHVPAERMTIGGTSQGMAVSMLVLLSSEYAFGAYVGSCGWIPLRRQMIEAMAGARSIANVLQECLQLGRKWLVPTTPVLITNNEDDSVINPIYGQEAAWVLEDLGFPVVFQQYLNGGHEVNEPKGWNDIEAFLKRQMG